MKKQYFALVILLCVFNGCQHYYYIPNNLNIPAMTQQHDASVQIGKLKSKCRQVQISYSPLKHIGLMYNDMRINEDQGTGRLQEAGAGLYYGIHNDVSFGLYGGWGQGWENHTYSSNPGYNTSEVYHADLKFQRMFLQPCFSFQGKFLQVATGLRFSNLTFNSGRIDNRIVQIPSEKSALDQIEKKSPFHFTELGFSFGVRLHAFTLGFQYVYLNYNKQETDLFRHKNLSFTAAVQLNDFWHSRWNTPEDE
jgi:hypothetical protein